MSLKSGHVCLCVCVCVCPGEYVPPSLSLSLSRARCPRAANDIDLARDHDVEQQVLISLVVRQQRPKRRHLHVIRVCLPTNVVECQR